MMLAHPIRLLSNYMRSPLQFHTSAAGKRTYFSSADPDSPSFPVSGIIPRLHFSFFPHRSSQGNLPGICQERDYPQHFSPGTGLTPDAPLQSHFRVHPSGRKNSLLFRQGIYFLRLSDKFQKDISSLLTYRHHFLP